MLRPDMVQVGVAALSPKHMGLMQRPRSWSLRLCWDSLRTQCSGADLQANQGDRKCHPTSFGAKIIAHLWERTQPES